MTKIGLLSDTHSFLDNNIFHHFEKCDEIWHCGDFGSLELIEKLQAFRPLKGVFGNIDNASITSIMSEQNIFLVEDVKVFMQHIGGYPGRYAKGVKDIIKLEKPKIFISGHSHILKVMYDKDLDCLHLNPGAAGKEGWHKMRTAMRFEIDGSDIRNMEIIELGKR